MSGIAFLAAATEVMDAALAAARAVGVEPHGRVEVELSAMRGQVREHDGVTVHVPLRALAQLRPDGFDWLVPGFRLELVTALIRSLPKELRRPLVPVPELAAEVVGRLQPRRGLLRDQVARSCAAVGVPPVFADRPAEALALDPVVLLVGAEQAQAFVRGVP